MANKKVPKLEIPKNLDRELQELSDKLDHMANDDPFLAEQPLSEGAKRLLDLIYNRMEIFR